MKIHVLIENTTDSDLQCEHGLSLYIEYQDKKILLDAGSTDVFAENARQMGTDLGAVDMAFLSHGHYDHSGGFGAFIRENKSAPVYAMEQVIGGYYSTSGGNLHGIGIPSEVMQELKERFAFVTDVIKVSEGITLVPHSTPGLEQIGERAGLYVQKGSALNSNIVPDDFAHEMSVVFETGAGLVICNSCSHGGVQNIVEEVQRALPGQKIYAYIGGLHMKGRKDGEEICIYPEKEVKALTEYIRDAGIEVLLTGHCTGEPAIALLEKYMEGVQLMRLCTGTVYDLDEA